MYNEEMIMFPFEYVAPISIEIEETNQGRALVSGVLLREGESGNGNLYTLDEMEKIAQRAIHVPVYVGATTKFVQGMYRKNAHNLDKKNCIGRIISTNFDKAKRVITYIAEVFNTDVFPKIIEEVKAGWGASIGGMANKARIVFDKANRMLTKVEDMIINHVQLLPPNVALGQNEAVIKNVEIEETLIVYDSTPLQSEQEYEPVNYKLKINL